MNKKIFFSFPDFERRSIEASGLVQEREDCCVSFHPGRHKESPDQIMRIFLEAGGSERKTIMGHLASEN